MESPQRDSNVNVGVSSLRRFRNCAIVPNTQMTAFEFFDWLTKNFYNPSITKIYRNDGHFSLEIEVRE